MSRYILTLHFKVKQECIPVGRVPSAAVAVSGEMGGVCPGGVCLVECLPRGVSAKEVSAQGDVCLGGVST